MQFLGQSILSIEQFDRAGVKTLFDTARRLEPYAARKLRTSVLDGTVLANLFFEPSTRTRVSFGVAFNRLGGFVRDTSGMQSTSLTKGESLFDTGRVIGGYADVMVVRYPEEGAVAEFAAATNIPVINAGDGPGEHPTQALLDAFTMEKELAARGKTVDGMHIVLSGDMKYGRTVHSLSKLLSLYQNVRFTFVSPAELRCPAKILDYVRARGHRVEETEDLAGALASADVLYATRLQKERLPEGTSLTYSEGFCVNRALMDKAAPKDIIIMHPLPRDGRMGANDLSDDLNGDDRLAIFKQTDNGVAVRMALFAEVLGVADKIEDTTRPVGWFVP
jgi:aspartate carbamoyltransferase catalytic subunit